MTEQPLHKGKAVILTAPSGAGKTTVRNYLLQTFPRLEFSVSATTRNPRKGEIDGKDYHFIPVEKFEKIIQENGFLEWEEVYPKIYYGTLKSEIEKIYQQGKIPLFDIDVKGALNLKRYFGENGLAIFIQPPSFEILIERLKNRASENPQSLQNRIERAKWELTFANRFDVVIVNDRLEDTFARVKEIVGNFLKTPS